MEPNTQAGLPRSVMPFLEPPTINRTFTLQEATASLPLVRSIVRDLMLWERRVRHIRFRLKFISRGGEELAYMFATEILGIERELAEAETELQQTIDELSSLGIEPEGPAIGLVDFPAQRDGETVFLCWQYGEPEIEFWHTLTGGFPERLPLTNNQASNQGTSSQEFSNQPCRQPHAV